MLRRLPLVLLLSILAAAPALAQGGGPVPRAIQLPDTMGADFAVTR